MTKVDCQMINMPETQPNTPAKKDQKKGRGTWWRLPFAVLAGATGAAVVADKMTEGEVSRAALATMCNRPVQSVDHSPNPQSPVVDLSKSPEINDLTNPKVIGEMDYGTFSELTKNVESEAARRTINEMLNRWLLKPSTVQEISQFENADPVVFPFRDDDGWYSRRNRGNVETYLNLSVITEPPEGVAPLYDNTIQFTLNGKMKVTPFGSLATEVSDEDGSFRLLDKATINLYDLKSEFIFNAFGIVQKDNKYYLVISRSDTSTSGYGYYTVPLNLEYIQDGTGFNNYVDFSEIEHLPNSGFKVTVTYSSPDGYHNFSETITVPLKNKRFEEFGMKVPGDSRPPQAIARANERQFRNAALTSDRATASNKT